MDQTLVENRKRKNSSDDSAPPRKTRKSKQDGLTTLLPSLTQEQVFGEESECSIDERKTWLAAQTVKKLSDTCGERGVKKSGKKDELIGRLLDSIKLPSIPNDPEESPSVEEQRTDANNDLSASPLHRFRPSNESKPTPTSFATANSSLSSQAQQAFESPSLIPDDVPHRRRVGELSTSQLKSTEVKRHYPSLQHALTSHIESLDLTFHHFTSDLSGLDHHQVALAYCVLAKRIQSLAHRSEPGLELKDAKLYAQTENHETALMAMDRLEQNFDMLACMEWHRAELVTQKEMRKSLEHHVMELERERENDARFFNDKIAKMAKRLGDVGAGRALLDDESGGNVPDDVNAEEDKADRAMRDAPPQTDRVRRAPAALPREPTIREQPTATEGPAHHERAISTNNLNVPTSAQIEPSSPPAPRPKGPTSPAYSSISDASLLTVPQNTQAGTPTLANPTQSSLPGLSTILPDSRESEGSEHADEGVNVPLAAFPSQITDAVNEASQTQLASDETACAFSSSATLHPAQPPSARAPTPKPSESSTDERVSRGEEGSLDYEEEDENEEALFPKKRKDDGYDEDEDEDLLMDEDEASEAP